MLNYFLDKAEKTHKIFKAILNHTLEGIIPKL